MSPGDKVVAAARRYIGCRESPPGSNRGPCVHHIQAATGAFGVAWCGSFCKRAYLDAGVDDDGIISASTWQTVENAKAKDALIKEPIPGCVIVWKPGASGHMEIVQKVSSRDRNGRVFIVLDVGGNTQDMVREPFRSVAGAYFIAPKALREPPPPVFRLVFWWEDPLARPERHGLYAATASREKAVRAWVAVNGSPGHVRRGKLSVMVKGKMRPRYTFWTGPRKRSPDFLTKAKRDADLKKVSAQRPGHILRPRSKRVRVS